MRARTILIASILVGAFVYFTSRPDSFLRKALNGGSDAKHWTDRVGAEGLGSDELNNIDV